MKIKPLALLDATRIANLVRFYKDDRGPISYLSKSDAIFNTADEYAFRCPVYALGKSLKNR